MSSTYGAELASGLNDFSNTVFASADESLAAQKKLRQDHYTKWRPGSNGATHVILGNLVKEKHDIFFGTTSSSPFTGNLFQFLQEKGYKIRLLHITAPDSVRVGSIQERDKTFVQTTEQDIVEKGNLVPQRISDTYLKYADEIQFFYRGGVDEDAVKAATWLRGDGSEKPILVIEDAARYKEIKKVHDAVCGKPNRADILWDATVDANASIR